MPAIVVKSGPEAGRRMELGLDDVAIGREEGDLVFEDPEVSRRHAVLRRSGESVVVEDLDSTNGTFVNGERIRSPITVGPGDQVRVGQTTLEIEPDWRADDTIVSRPPRPDQIRTAEVRPPEHLVAEDEDATQPLPTRIPESGPPPARSKRRWRGLGIAAIAVLLGVIGVVAYTAVVDRSAENDFAARANDACATVERSGGGLDLSRGPTRGALGSARNIRLQGLGAIRALERPEEDAAVVSSFLSAFGETNASITRLEAAIGAGNHRVAPALQNLRGDLRDERELAGRVGIEACGGLAFR